MNASPKFADLDVESTISPMTTGPVTRTQLALFAGASGDHNPIHLDDEEARAGGLPGVIVHGMFMMATLGQMLTAWVPQSNLRKFSNRFASMAVPGDTITCSGEVMGKRQEGGENLVDLEIKAENQNGQVLLLGGATVALD